ncbi:MAG: hypothetical protein WCT52_04180 [Candidatus Micrarchaeia archaeon]
MAFEKRAEALSKGEVVVQVKRNSIMQKLTFRLVRKKTNDGEVPYLVLDKFLDVSELVRVAEEYQLPVESPVGKIYPKGKKEIDFLGI